MAGEVAGENERAIKKKKHIKSAGESVVSCSAS